MKLSIITINYNNAAGLKKTMDSVIHQTYKEFEFIVIDGDSNDGSKEIISENAHRLTYWISEKDTGIYNAMNKGIKKATGQYLLFLNSGDFLESNSVVESILPSLKNEDIIYGNMVIDRNGVLERVQTPDKLEFEEMIRGTLWHPVSFIKKELFDKYGTYSEHYKIISDYEFFLKTIFIHRASTLHVDLFISVFNTDGIGSSSKFMTIHDQEKREVQLKLFHPEIIDSAIRFSDLKRSKAQIIHGFIKSKPLIHSFSKKFYSAVKRFF